MGTTSPYGQLQQIGKKKPIDLKPVQPLNMEASPMASPTASPESPLASAGAGLLGGLAQIGEEMSKPMEVMQAPEWIPNQGVMGKADPMQTPPIFQAGEQLKGATLL